VQPYPAKGFKLGQRIVIYNNLNQWTYARITQIVSDTILRVDTANVGSTISDGTYASIFALDKVEPLILSGGGSFAEPYADKWSILGYFEVDDTFLLKRVISLKNEHERRNPYINWVPSYILDQLPEVANDSAYEENDKYNVGDIVIRATTDKPKRGYLMDGSSLPIEDYPLAFKNLGFSQGYGTPVAQAGTIEMVAGNNIITGSGTQFQSSGSPLRKSHFILLETEIYEIIHVSDDTHLTVDRALHISLSGLKLYRLTEFQLPKAGDYFMRLWDGTPTTDGVNRTDQLGNIIGDLPGSYQPFEMEDHKHNDSGFILKHARISGGGSGIHIHHHPKVNNYDTTIQANLGSPMNPVDGSDDRQYGLETRPKNILLVPYYIADI
ncbi:MAG: hypothetical protein F6K39_14820, partial [Okeania sp. SIO3B3]|nr:hypothetical protein [Okeania sp. SIO3B3]